MDEPITDWDSHDTDGYEQAVQMYFHTQFWCLFLLIPCFRFVFGALGYLQQRALVHGFYHEGKPSADDNDELAMVACNTEDASYPGNDVMLEEINNEA